MGDMMYQSSNLHCTYWLGLQFPHHCFEWWALICLLGFGHTMYCTEFTLSWYMQCPRLHGTRTLLYMGRLHSHAPISSHQNWIMIVPSFHSYDIIINLRGIHISLLWKSGCVSWMKGYVDWTRHMLLLAYLVLCICQVNIYNLWGWIYICWFEMFLY